jgi:hypothetical protein
MYASIGLTPVLWWSQSLWDFVVVDPMPFLALMGAITRQQTGRVVSQRPRLEQAASGPLCEPTIDLNRAPNHARFFLVTAGGRVGEIACDSNVRLLVSPRPAPEAARKQQASGGGCHRRDHAQRSRNATSAAAGP